MQKYSVFQHLIETIFSCVKSGEIAIPEIFTQRRKLIAEKMQKYNFKW